MKLKNLVIFSSIMTLATVIGVKLFKNRFEIKENVEEKKYTKLNESPYKRHYIKIN